MNVLSCAKTQSFGLQACLFLSSLCLSAVPKLGFNLRCLSAVLPVTAMSDKHHCSCCSHPVSSPSVHQTLDEMDFERGLHSFVKPTVLDYWTVIAFQTKLSFVCYLLACVSRFQHGTVLCATSFCRYLVSCPGWRPAESQAPCPEGD